MKKKVLLLGSGGQLGRSLLASPLAQDHRLTALSRSQLDITDSAALRARLDELRPDVVINATAYTAVDAAESHRDSAFAINERAVRELALAVQAIDSYLIHVSTDFVFSGEASRPYTPQDEAKPVSVYGASKLAGEQAVQTLLPQRSLIVRTAWLYSPYGSNFLKTMLRLMAERPELRVVSDQVGTPCAIHTLSQCIIKGVEIQPQGALCHWSDAGVASWYDFAVAIQEEALALDLLPAAIPIHPIASSDYPTPARRPAYSVLDKRAAVELLGCSQLHWRVALREVMRQLAQEQTPASGA